MDKKELINRLQDIEWDEPYEELQDGDLSLPRNPLITKMFRVIDLSENAGYGFDKIIKGWTSHYSAKPVVSGSIDNYRIEFFFEKDLGNGLETTQKTTQITTQKIIIAMTENPMVTRNELIEMVGSKLVEKVGSKLVENQLKIILLLVQSKPEITKKELSEILNISTTAIDKNIQKLKNLNIIKRVGPDKGGHWEVLK